MKILVTGGAGYIGGFMTRRLLDEGYEVIVLDNFERGHRSGVDERALLEEGNLLDSDFLNKVFSSHEIDAIIHFAGYISMGESMEKPDLYFSNNTFATLNLLQAAQKRGVGKIIFSSTAGVYGMPETLPIAEDHPKKPENPYGESKLMIEQILHWHNKAYGLSYVALRYFNACGASLDGKFGEEHDPESHIIPNAINAALAKIPFKLFGSDYDTADGTCVRDYIHVLDLVDAHVLALKKLDQEKGGFYYNVGTGKGYSNNEVVEMIKNVSGIDFEVEIEDRRPGDADSLVADTTKIVADLGFDPKHSDLETIVKTAFEYHKNKKKNE